MPGGEVPFSIEVFRKVVPQHRRNVVVADGEEVTFRKERCPGSDFPPIEIWVEHETLCAMCQQHCSTAIEWDEVKNDWVVR